jgi:hypothetical protein
MSKTTQACGYGSLLFAGTTARVGPATAIIARGDSDSDKQSVAAERSWIASDAMRRENAAVTDNSLHVVPAKSRDP